MASMAVLTTFLWSNEDSDSFWHFELSSAIWKIAEVAKLIDFWMSDNLLSTLLRYGRKFRFWATASLSFGTPTNSQLFRMSSLSPIFLPHGISETLPPNIVLPPQPTRRIRLDLCLLRQDCYYLSH